MESPAIIFTHKGKPAYLSYALYNAQISNPNSRIILLGDETNKGLPCCRYQHAFISDYFSYAQEFQKTYIYQSSNSYDYELFCFQRWFIIKEFVEKNGIEHFIACDSDVLIYEDLSNYYDHSKWQGDFLNVVDNNGPQCVYFTKESIGNFCDYITKQYTDTDCIERLNKRWQKFVDNKIPGGNCDMTMFTNYQEDFPEKFFNIYGFDNIKKNNMFFYDTSNYKSHNKEFFLHKIDRGLPIAKMKFKNGVPYIMGIDGNLYKSPAIHFQGPYKALMKKNSYAGKSAAFFAAWFFNKLMRKIRKLARM